MWMFHVCRRLILYFEAAKRHLLGVITSVPNYQFLQLNPSALIILDTHCPNQWPLSTSQQQHSLHLSLAQLQHIAAMKFGESPGARLLGKMPTCVRVCIPDVVK